jgi:hypothetical protein
MSRVILQDKALRWHACQHGLPVQIDLVKQGESLINGEGGLEWARVDGEATALLDHPHARPDGASLDAGAVFEDVSRHCLWLQIGLKME